MHSAAKDRYHILSVTLNLAMRKVQPNLIHEATFVDSKVKTVVFGCSEIAVLRQLHEYKILFVIL